MSIIHRSSLICVFSIFDAKCSIYEVVVSGMGILVENHFTSCLNAAEYELTFFVIISYRFSFLYTILGQIRDNNNNQKLSGWGILPPNYTDLHYESISDFICIRRKSFITIWWHLAYFSLKPIIRFENVAKKRRNKCGKRRPSIFFLVCELTNACTHTIPLLVDLPFVRLFLLFFLFHLLAILRHKKKHFFLPLFIDELFPKKCLDCNKFSRELRFLVSIWFPVTMESHLAWIIIVSNDSRSNYKRAHRATETESDRGKENERKENFGSVWVSGKPIRPQSAHTWSIFDTFDTFCVIKFVMTNEISKYFYFCDEATESKGNKREKREREKAMDI